MSSGGTELFDRLLNLLERELEDGERLRRRIHARPDLSGEEHSTRELLLEILEGMSDPSEMKVERVASSGAVVTFEQPQSQGRPIALRAELDALPVSEATTVSWASQNAGVMHACGHDVHLAAVVCAAKVLLKVGLVAPLVVVLQPREETSPSGALDILGQSGTIRSSRAMVAAHVQPSLPCGEVACVEGVVNSSSDTFTVGIAGIGGHAAYPHLVRDPIQVAAQIVMALNASTGRVADPTSTSVLSVTRIAAGTTTNVVPATATIGGTIRASTSADRERLRTHLETLATSIAVGFDCEATVSIANGEPPLYNDPALVRPTSELLLRRGLDVNHILRSAGADDFSFYTECVPSLMMFVGVEADADVGVEQRLHDASFLPSDSSVRDVAVALLAGYVAACSLV